jgi:radical SAM protein with 4Fe4S-binding SPASM domain
MTLFAKNAPLIEETYQAIKYNIADFKPRELHLNIPHQSSHYYRNLGVAIDPKPGGLQNEVEKFYKRYGRALTPLSIIESLYEKKANVFLATGKSPMNCSALSASVYISEKGELYPCTIWDKPIGNLRSHNYDIMNVLNSQMGLSAREKVKSLSCPQCWSPCEAFPSIMTNLPQALT